MIIKDIEFTLKDGRKALLRAPKEEEAQEMIDYLRITSGETNYLLRYPEECDGLSIEAEIEFIRRSNELPNEAMIVCEVDGKIAGNCHIDWSKRIKTRHRASVAVAILKEYWGLGIGSRMFEEMIRIAEENKQILQMELDFIEGNDRARALYEKMGFRITGVLPNGTMLKDGTLLNEYTMIREIKR